MKKESVRPATVALLLAVVLVCAMVLQVLSVSTAAADFRLAQKYADTVQAEYALDGQAAQWLSALEAQIAAGEVTDGIVKKQIGGADERHLEIELAVRDGAYAVLAWRLTAPRTAGTGMENLLK